MSSKSNDKSNKKTGIDIERIRKIMNGEDVSEKVVTVSVIPTDTFIAYI